MCTYLASSNYALNACGYYICNNRKVLTEDPTIKLVMINGDLLSFS